MYTEIFGLLKSNESTGSDKDEEVQRRTAEVYSENLRNTKLCHSSSTRVPASLWNQGRQKKVEVHSKRLWESQSPLWYNRISSRNLKKRPRTKRIRENAEKLKVMLNDKQQFSVKVPLHDAIYCMQHYLPTPTSPACSVQHIAYTFTRGNKLQVSCLLVLIEEGHGTGAF